MINYDEIQVGKIYLNKDGKLYKVTSTYEGNITANRTDGKGKPLNIYKTTCGDWSEKNDNR